MMRQRHWKKPDSIQPRFGRFERCSASQGTSCQDSRQLDASTWPSLTVAGAFPVPGHELCADLKAVIVIM